MLTSTTMYYKVIKLFLSLSIATGFFSAIADRCGLWDMDISVWGNWSSFLAYTETINPWFPDDMIPSIGMTVTIVEFILGLFLLIGFRTELSAKLSGYLLLTFALAMTFSTGIKGVFDFSVLSASAAAFSLSIMKEKYLEIDHILFSRK